MPSPLHLNKQISPENSRFLRHTGPFISDKMQPPLENIIPNEFSLSSFQYNDGAGDPGFHEEVLHVGDAVRIGSFSDANFHNEFNIDPLKSTMHLNPPFKNFPFPGSKDTEESFSFAEHQTGFTAPRDIVSFSSEDARTDRSKRHNTNRSL